MNKIEYLNDVNVVCKWALFVIFAGAFLLYIYNRYTEYKYDIYLSPEKEIDPILDPEGKRYKEIKSLLDELDALDIAIQNERDMDTLFILWKQRTEAGIKIEILIN
jgi:hypothetical protein